MQVKMCLRPAQVHAGGQSEAMPSASTGREAAVLELADLDREVTRFQLSSGPGFHTIPAVLTLHNSIVMGSIYPANSPCSFAGIMPDTLCSSR